jgi:subtilase family serine protease
MFLCLSASPSAQSNLSRTVTVQRIDESKLAVLSGNTHPLARIDFDTGPAPANLPMERILLALKRRPEREAALERLMTEQLDRFSPNYHKWLTPEQFGTRFGASDQDLHTITDWLASHGFVARKIAPPG